MGLFDESNLKSEETWYNKKKSAPAQNKTSPINHETKQIVENNWDRIFNKGPKVDSDKKQNLLEDVPQIDNLENEFESYDSTLFETELKELVSSNKIKQKMALIRILNKVPITKHLKNATQDKHFQNSSSVFRYLEKKNMFNQSYNLTVSFAKLIICKDIWDTDSKRKISIEHNLYKSKKNYWILEHLKKPIGNDKNIKSEDLKRQNEKETIDKSNEIFEGGPIKTSEAIKIINHQIKNPYELGDDYYGVYLNDNSFKILRGENKKDILNHLLFKSENIPNTTDLALWLDTLIIFIGGGQINWCKNKVNEYMRNNGDIGGITLRAGQIVLSMYHYGILYSNEDILKEVGILWEKIDIDHGEVTTRYHDLHGFSLCLRDKLYKFPDLKFGKKYFLKNLNHYSSYYQNFIRKINEKEDDW